jgi:glycosyltransferase involved in cell wall biosynthesis
MSEVLRREAVSIVVPCYNEADVFPHLQQALSQLADTVGQDHDVEIILVDDGSRDATWKKICAFSALDSRVRGLSLSRNFGHQAALTCGYDVATGDAVVCMDADLQDPPEVILEMIRLWREGADVVYGVRASREGETTFKLWTAKLFYRLIRAMGAEYVRADAGDFRLLSRRGVEALKKMREEHRFIRGMVGWIGFRVAEVSYVRTARVAGITKYPFRKMLLFALNAIVSFSSFPLRLAYIMAFGLSAVLMSYLVYTFCMYAFYRVELVPGWTSLILSVMAFGAMNLFCLGIIGEYVGRIYEQSKQRPLYLIGEDTHWGRRSP